MHNILIKSSPKSPHFYSNLAIFSELLKGFTFFEETTSVMPVYATDLPHVCHRFTFKQNNMGVFFALSVYTSP